MFRWLPAFVRRELVSDVPPEMELCLDCGKLMCSEGEFRDCARRKERAAELVLGLAAPEGAEIDWQPLPPLWPSPAVSTDVGGFILLVFTEDNVSTWEVRRKAKKDDGRDDDLVVGGTADTFEAAKAAALFEATARSSE